MILGINLKRYPVKRVFFILLGSLFLFFPGQSYYQLTQVFNQPSRVQGTAIDFPTPAFYPVNTGVNQAPFLSARSVLVMDRDSSVILYEKNPLLRLLPASTVKMMTGLVALEHYDLDQVLTVPPVSHEGQDMELVTGEQIKVIDLLYGLLVSSANDAALALAQNYPGGEKAFVEAMNKKAQDLNLANSFFTNPTGMDQEELGFTSLSYASTLDLARLSVYALKKPVFAQMVATPKMVVTDITGGIVHELFNINELLTFLEGVKGIKTGWTENAGECLVAYTEREGRGIITVVLGSNDRFGETQVLIEWVFANHRWQPFLPTQE